MQDRYLKLPEAEGLDRLRNELMPWYTAVGPILEVTFPAALTDRDVQHDLQTVPTGVLVLLAEGGDVRAARVSDWSHTTAYLRATEAGTRARVIFCVTKEARRA